MFERLIITHGFIGYRKTWTRGEFPLSELLLLKNYRNTNQSFPTRVEINKGFEVIKSDIKDEIELFSK